MSDTSTRVLTLIRELYGPIEAAPLDLDTRLDATLVDDLKLDSLDLIELAMSTEDEFGVEIPDDEAELFGPSRNGEGKTIRDWVALVDAKLGARVVA